VAESVLSDLSTALDLIVLEQLPGGGFLKARDSYIPNWFLGAFRHAVGEDPVSLQDAFPVLDTFLKEAEALWSGPTEGRADSEPFIIVDRSGSELPVKATAVAVRGHRYLILQLAIEFNERRQMLQTAREQSLAHERMVRQLQDLRKPIATLAQLVDDPTFTTDVHNPAANGIRQQVAALRGLLDELPRTSQGTTRQRR